MLPGVAAIVREPQSPSDAPAPGGPPSPDARLGLEALVQTVRSDLLGLDHGLLGQLLQLVLHPRATAGRIVESTERPMAVALRLFLVANVLFFLVGPSVGLLNYTVDSLAGVPGYAGLIQDQIGRLGWSLEVYRARFNTAFEFRQPALVIVMVPVLVAASAVLLRRGHVGRHLVVGLLGLAWLLVVWPTVRLVLSVAEAAGVPLAFAAPLTVGLLGTSAVWAMARVGGGAFALKPGPALGYGVFMTGGFLLALIAHGQISFWVTFVLLEFGL